MIFKIHYLIEGVPDSVRIEGETVQEVREKAEEFMNERGVDIKTCWSEEL